MENKKLKLVVSRNATTTIPTITGENDLSEFVSPEEVRENLRWLADKLYKLRKNTGA